MYQINTWYIYEPLWFILVNCSWIFFFTFLLCETNYNWHAICSQIPLFQLTCKQYICVVHSRLKYKKALAIVSHIFILLFVLVDSHDIYTQFFNILLSDLMNSTGSPFEFRALEVTLEAICSFLDARTTELETDAYPALDELTSKVSGHARILCSISMHLIWTS